MPPKDLEEIINKNPLNRKYDFPKDDPVLLEAKAHDFKSIDDLYVPFRRSKQLHTLLVCMNLQD